MTNLLLQELRKPYGRLIPPAAVVCFLLIALWAVGSLGLDSAEQRRAQLSAQWAQARKEHQQHQAARRAKQDLAQVWAALPEERDFAPLALGITEEAKRNQVTLPALSYKTESTPVTNTSKGVLQGTMSGRYEDLRRFIYDIETADELVYIEDVDLVPAATQQDHLTFNIKIVTYLRGEAGKPVAQ
ncbi:MAG TPA: type 4a pilus biogenesis protein PilO [Nitrospira sp.]|jgi:Tfp pilus assembly protein PilO|nr:type 4a pilus biogenesis protein PilO [Nitrospira sp.]